MSSSLKYYILLFEFLAFSCLVNGDYKSYIAGLNVVILTRIGRASSDQALPNPTQTTSTSQAVNQLPIWAINGTFDGHFAQTLAGVPVPSLTATQAIGTRGQALLQDFILFDKLTSYNRERIPERVVHAKGAGAHGFFVVTHDISQYTKAKFLNGIGKKVPVFVRFSTVGGELGTPDTQVDPHGFATKFYTEEGNHDLVGNNIESFPIRDPMLFPDLNRARKRNPQTNLGDLTMWWDFTANRPESTLHALHLHSDIGRPDGFRRANGFGVHTFKLVNEHGDVVFCKFHWRTQQPAPALTWERAKELLGENPEYKTQDLYDAIARKDYPKWTLHIQVMTIDQANKHPRNPFDITRTWREEDYPLIPIGKMTLNRNPTDYFAEVEQAAFAPSNMVPGIEPSPDRMLAARLFSYQDAHRYRLTVNSAQIPINKPVVPVTSYSRNGQACHGNNGAGSPNYYPNSFGGLEADTEGAAQTRFSVEGIVDRHDIPEDEYVEARIFLERDVDPAQRKRLVGALADRIKDAAPIVREKALRNLFYPVSEEFGDEVRAAIEKALGSIGGGKKSDRKKRKNKS